MRTKLYLALLAQLRKAERLWAAPLPSLVGNFEFSLQIEFAICTPTCAATLGDRWRTWSGVLITKRFGRLTAGVILCVVGMYGGDRGSAGDEMGLRGY